MANYNFVTELFFDYGIGICILIMIIFAKDIPILIIPYSAFIFLGGYYYGMKNIIIKEKIINNEWGIEIGE